MRQRKIRLNTDEERAIITEKFLFYREVGLNQAVKEIGWLVEQVQIKFMMEFIKTGKLIMKK